MVAALVLHWYVPLPWPTGAVGVGTTIAGLCALCIGIALEIVAVLTFRRHITTIMPHRAASSLITDGPFPKSRNPMYLGNTILVMGSGLFFGVAWLILSALMAAFLVQKLSVEREERHLEARFGDAWQDYASRTPRWLSLRSRLWPLAAAPSTVQSAFTALFGEDASSWSVVKIDR